MNKKYKIILVIILVLSLTAGFKVNEENSFNKGLTDETILIKNNEISKLINERKSKANFYEFSVIRRSNKKNLSMLAEFVKKADIFELNSSQLQTLLNSSTQDIILKIDSKENGLFELELTNVNYTPEYIDIQVMNGTSITHQKFKTGLSFSGIIKGDNNSFASLTIFENCVMGLICNDKGNFVLGPKKDENNKFTGDYIFYNDRDLLIKNNFKCGTDDYSPINQKGLALKNLHNHISMSAGPTDSIRVFFVADYQMYLDNGSNITQVAQFINGVFNNTSLIYHNEQIPIKLASTVSVYTSPDPYINLNDSYAILNLFGANTQDNFNGDLAHLLSTGHGQQLGGIAWINVLCQPYVYFPPPDDVHYGRFAFSNIEPNYLPYPVYSWTVMVITHELGHNVASKHTHACVWPTISGQIDSCYTSEGGCVSGTHPNYNGTIMSYCHLNGAINLVNGFGPLPQDTIQLGYSLALCLDTALNSSELPINFDLMQNYPNPFNPGTNIRFAMPVRGYVTLKVYDITGREVTTLLSNQFYEAGFFTSSFDASHYSLASGVYLYKLDVINDNKSIYSQIKKMVLVK